MAGHLRPGRSVRDVGLIGVANSKNRGAHPGSSQGANDLAQEVHPEDLPGAQEYEGRAHQPSWVQAGAGVLAT